MENQELQHHGIKGQKWGVRRTPAQLGHTTKKKKTETKPTAKTIADGIAKKVKQFRTNSANKKAAAQKQAEEKEKLDFEAEKQKALTSGSASDVLKFQGKVSNQELQTAVNRLNLERQLSEISGKENKSGVDKISEVMDKVDKLRAAGEKGVNAYNLIAKVTNTFTDADLPTIDGKSKTEKAVNKANKEKEEALNKLIKSGTAEDIKNNFGSFTAKQLGEINARFSAEDKIRERIQNESAAKAAQKQAEEAEKAAKRQAEADAKAAKQKAERDAAEARETARRLVDSMFVVNPTGLYLPAPRNDD